MKKLILPILGLFLVSFLFSCKPSAKEALEYNDAIISQQAAIIEKINALNDTYENYVAKDMDAAFENCMNQINTSTEAVKKLSSFGGSESFKEEALKLFAIYKNVMEKNHSEMIRLYKLPEDKYTQKEIDMWDKYSKEANHKIDAGFSDFKKVQDEFIKKYNLKKEEKK